MFRLRINRAGFPAHTSFAGMSFVTTEDAPIIAFSPMTTDLHITLLHPKKAFFLSMTG